MILPLPPSENNEPDLDALQAQMQKEMDRYNRTRIRRSAGFRLKC